MKMSINKVDEMEGVETSQDTCQTQPLLTEDEKRVLEVYDRLEELQLEIALLKAQGVLTQDDPMEATKEDIKSAEKELLNSTALYRVRNNVIETTLIVNPIVKAVHAGSNASIAEQDLLPLLHKRDELSITLSSLSTKDLAAKEELKKVESEHMILQRSNAELASTMLALAAQANSQNKDDIGDPKLRQQLEEVEAGMKSSRQRWRIIKGTASATIAGSGVDWSRDPELLDIVLDKEGDE